MTVGNLLKVRSLIVDPKVFIISAEGSGNAVVAHWWFLAQIQTSWHITLRCSPQTDSGDHRYRLRALNYSSSSDAASAAVCQHPDVTSADLAPQLA